MDFTQVSRHYHRKRFKALLALVVALLSLFISRVPVIDDLEKRLLDYRFQNWSHTAKPDSNIIIISIDNSSLDYFAENGISWPWPRSFYAHVVDYLTDAGAKQIVFDMLFTHADADRSETDAEETDTQFALAMERSKRSILGEMINGDIFNQSQSHSELDKNGTSNLDTLRGESVIVRPIPLLMGACQGVGHTNILPDEDGILRHTKPLFKRSGMHVFSLAAVAYIQGSGIRNIKWDDEHLVMGNTEVPLTNGDDLLLDWYGSPGPMGSFPYLSFSSVIQSASAVKNGGIPQFKLEYFKDKIVFIGADAAGLRDLKSTPVSQRDMHPGMEIWATALSNLNQKDFIYPFSTFVLYLITMLISFTALLSFDRMKARYAFGILLGSFAAFVALAYVLWMMHPRYFLPIVPAIMVSVLSYLVVLSNEMRERLFLKQVFGPYISPELMKVVYRTREIPELGGDQIEGTAFFSDIQDFTGISEKLGPTQLVSLLNEYLTEMTDILIAHGGTLDKYEGDAIIAFFGAPVHNQNHPLNAVTAAIEMQKGLDRLREKWRHEGDMWPPEIKDIQMRIGINSGEMMVGNVGSRGRMNFTMMGDTVNVAARLETSAKQYGILTHISAETARNLPESISSRSLGKSRLAGKSQVSESFEILGYTADLSQEEKELLKLWPQGLEAIRERDWDLAASLFKKTKQLERQITRQATNPSHVYLEVRIPYWRSLELGDDWQAIWEFDKK
ncbi:MAG: adenylate/guanylate cyclase domain-containing protein [Candidatus Marinimicrobia bacterium]|nr:adenylate/guanylate cyclase domain-containing protein [Candidatus Neomarinimicrobiota bacterium]